MVVVGVVVAKTGEAESHMVSYFNMCNRKYGRGGFISFMQRFAEDPHITAKATSQKF